MNLQIEEDDILSTSSVTPHSPSSSTADVLPSAISIVDSTPAKMEIRKKLVLAARPLTSTLWKGIVLYMALHLNKSLTKGQSLTFLRNRSADTQMAVEMTIALKNKGFYPQISDPAGQSQPPNLNVGTPDDPPLRLLLRIEVWQDSAATTTFKIALHTVDLKNKSEAVYTSSNHPTKVHEWVLPAQSFWHIGRMHSFVSVDNSTTAKAKTTDLGLIERLRNMLFILPDSCIVSSRKSPPR